MLMTGKALLVVALLAVYPLSALAENDKDIWACKAQGADEEDLWLVAWGSQSYIKLYGNRVWGNHYTEDETLRWDFGRGKGGLANYSAILQPGGRMAYYDFTNLDPETAAPATYDYRCRVAQS